MTTALGGLRVLDQTQVMAGPFCSMLLADMGADVVKIEPPGGEHTRREHEIAPGVSASFLAVNRNKRSLMLDLKRPEGVAVLKRLVATADVLVENYRPGVAKRLGVDYETLRAINPRLVYASISGFGQDGPYRERPGLDQIAFHCAARSTTVPAFEGVVRHFGFSGGRGRPAVSFSGFTVVHLVITDSRRGRSFTGLARNAASMPAR